MTNTDNTGGPAFPTPAGYSILKDYHPGHGDVERTVPICTTGLTILDFIAIHAMQGMLAADASPTADDLGECAYAAARNMLAAKARFEAAVGKPVVTCPGCLAGSPDQGEGHDEKTCPKHPLYVPF